VTSAVYNATEHVSLRRYCFRLSRGNVGYSSIEDALS
jgi:hypothetical protein